MRVTCCNLPDDCVECPVRVDSKSNTVIMRPLTNPVNVIKFDRQYAVFQAFLFRVSVGPLLSSSFILTTDNAVYGNFSFVFALLSSSATIVTGTSVVPLLSVHRASVKLAFVRNSERN